MARAGADRLAPVRFAALVALARRAGAHAGTARRVLDARLAALLADYAAIIISAKPGRGSAPTSRCSARSIACRKTPGRSIRAASCIARCC
ncbi:DUF2894 domain-containing protein [Burkholderia glumae]|uniref:DUF2894 domain-containing protein n=1 Tax=Burkholderia glumae TaxID=337 RepID=UPI003F594661